MSFLAAAIVFVAASANAQNVPAAPAPIQEQDASATQGAESRSTPPPQGPSASEPTSGIPSPDPSPPPQAAAPHAADESEAGDPGAATQPGTSPQEEQVPSSPAPAPPESAVEPESSERPRFPPASEVKAVGEHPDGYAQRTVGVRGVAVFNDANQPLAEVAFYERGVALLAGPWVSGRYVDEMWIGGGGGGVTYSLSGNLAVGIRRDVGPGHGPFARVELRGDLRRTGGVYHSSLRFPGLQLGWGGNHGRLFFEALGHSGFSSTGRLETEDRQRDIRGWFTGGAWSLGWDRLQVHGDVSYLFIGNPGFWDARAHLCSLWGKKPPKKWYSKSAGPSSVNNGPFAVDYSFAVCSDASFLRTESRVDGSPLFEQWAFGLSIVVGQFSRLDPLRKP